MSYPLELASLNLIAQDILTVTGTTPFTFFLASIAAAILFYAFDINKGLSLDFPGRGQIGLSAAAVFLGAMVMLLGAEGYKFFFTEVGKTTVSLLLITPFAYYLIGRE